MDDKIVSIIMPVYNAESYLVATLDSVINQSFKNIEILIVDDGSTDKSIDIIKEYQNKYQNIIVICQECNMGQSAARNKALGFSHGDYVYFMDSDDILPHKAIETLVREILSDDYDFVIGDVTTLGSNTTNMYSTNCRAPEILSSNVEIVNRYIQKGWCVAPWAKLFKKDFLVEYNIFFKEGIILEDELFTFSYVFHGNKAKIVPDIVYNYFIRNNSTMTQSLSTKHLDGMVGDIKGMKTVLNNNFCTPLTAYIILMAYRLVEALLLGKIDVKNKKQYVLFLQKEISFSIILRTMFCGPKKAVKAMLFLLPSSLWLLFLKMLRRT